MLGRLSMVFWRRWLFCLGVLGVMAATAGVVHSSGGEEGGIGGTGIYFGQVTGLSSVVMNGERIELPDSVTISSVEGAPQGGTLSVGDTVFLTTTAGAGGPIATRAVRFFPVVGPVDWSLSTESELSIMGTRVAASAAVFVNADGAVVPQSQLSRDNTTYAVNGIWRNAKVIATRIVALGADVDASISGLVGSVDGQAIIGGTAISGAAAEEGTFVTAVGDATGSGIEAETATPGLLNYAPFDRPSKLSALAFLSPDPDGQGFHLSGFGIPMDAASTVGNPTGLLRVFKGTMNERFLITEAR